MALPDYDPDDVTGDTVHVLRTLLANFSLSPLRSGKSVRDLMLSDYDGFRIAAMIVLREPMDVRGLRYLVTFLWTNDLLISILGDITLPRELSISLAQIAVKVDTQFHIKLIRFLVTGMLEGREVEEKSANRLLEVLGAISDGASVQGFLRQMLQHPNPRIRSKISLLVGYGGGAGPAIRKVIGDQTEDPRVRANALEALWPNPDKEVLELFCEMLDDLNSRVAGNAALGLYLIGDPRSIPAIRRMAASAELLFQQTAAWVMGQTEDPRFLPDLGRLLGQPQGNLRKRVFQSLMAIKNASARRAKNPPLWLTITNVGQTDTGDTAVRLSLTCSEPGEPPEVPPTGFAILMDGKPVDQFSCTERRNAEICVSFLIPRRPIEPDPLRDALRVVLSECLEEKRAPDKWFILRYEEPTANRNTSAFRLFGETMEKTVRVPEKDKKKNAAALTANPATLRSEIDSSGLRSEIAASAFEGIIRIVNVVKPLRTPRYALVVFDSEEDIDPEAFESLAVMVRTSGVAVNAISTVFNYELEILCRESSGIFHMVSDVSAIGPAIRAIYQSFKAEYLIEFTSGTAESAASGNVTIHAYSASSFGEATLALNQTGAALPELVESNA